MFRLGKVITAALIVIGLLFTGIGCNCEPPTIASCAQWGDVYVTWSGYPPEAQTIQNGGTAGSCVMVYTGTPITLETSAQCNSGSSPSYLWAVTKIQGTIEGPYTGGSLPVVFYPQSIGRFKVEIFAICDAVLCAPCTVYIELKDIEEAPCSCGPWNQVTVTWGGSTAGTWVGNPDDTATITSIDSSTPILVESSVNCSSGCQADYTNWEVITPAGASLFGNGLPASFIPATTGCYAAILNASCNDTPCLPCKITICVNEIQPADCCVALQDCDIIDIGIASDGHTIYAISDTCNGVYRSTDGGCSFAQCSLPSGFVFPPQAIAIAPDDLNIVAVSDSSPDEVVWLTSSGANNNPCCGTWASLGSPCIGNDTLTDLAISPAAAGWNIFATIADNGDFDTHRGDVRVIGVNSSNPAWTSISNLTGTHDYMAIQASPNYPADLNICLVGVAAAPGTSPEVDYQLVLTQGAGTIIQDVNITSGTTSDFALPAAGHSIVHAGIAVAPDFNASDETVRDAFVGIASNILQSTDDVYLIPGNAPPPNAYRLDVLGGNPIGIRSIYYNGTKLLVGEHANTNVWHTVTPYNPAWVCSAPSPLGQTDAVVGINPLDMNICYAGTSGAGSCFSISDDNAHTFCHPSLCSCIQWDQVELTWHGLGAEHWTATNGGSTGISIDYGSVVSVDGSVQCSTSCSANYSWTVTKIIGALEGPYTGAGLPIAFWPQTLGGFLVEISANCDGVVCAPYSFIVNMKIIPEPCTCVGWNPTTVTWSGTGSGNWTGNCTDTCTIPSIDTGTDVLIYYDYDCSGSCAPSYNWTVTKSTTPLEGPWSGTGWPASFSPTSPGTFIAVLNASCDNVTPCTPCRIFINIGAVSECQCGDWNPIQVTYWPTLTQSGNWTGNCGDTLTICTSQYEHGMSVTSSLSCVDCLSATPEYSYEVIGANGTIIFSGSGNTFGFSPLHIGSYQVIFHAACNGMECSSCILNVNELQGQLYEHNNPDADGWSGLGQTKYIAQVFTAESDHVVTAVKLRLARDPTSNPGLVTVSIKAVAGGILTGPALATGTTDGNSLTSTYPGEWRYITLNTSITLTSGTTYAIQVSAANADSASSLLWCVQSPGTYAGGQYEQSQNSGWTWSIEADMDLLFELWGCQ